MIQSTLDLVVKPEEKDIEEVLEWLKDEFLSSGNGFYNNKNIILDSFSKGETLVLKEESKSIGLAILSRNDNHVDLDIFVIKLNYRNQGYGKIFYNKISIFLVKNGFLTIKLFCAPATSERFWRKMGLTKLPIDILCSHKLTYYDIIGKTASTLYIKGADKIELWNIDYYKSISNEPMWVWYVDPTENEFQYPIIHPCDCNWKIRISRNGKTLKENKVKYITDEFNEFYNSPFLVFYGL